MIAFPRRSVVASVRQKYAHDGGAPRSVAFDVFSRPGQTQAAVNRSVRRRGGVRPTSSPAGTSPVLKRVGGAGETRWGARPPGTRKAADGWTLRGGRRTESGRPGFERFASDEQVERSPPLHPAPGGPPGREPDGHSAGPCFDRISLWAIRLVPRAQRARSSNRVLRCGGILRHPDIVFSKAFARGQFADWASTGEPGLGRTSSSKRAVIRQAERDHGRTRQSSTRAQAGGAAPSRTTSRRKSLSLWAHEERTGP